MISGYCSGIIFPGNDPVTDRHLYNENRKGDHGGRSLSFLGFGANVSEPEWGAMLSQGRSYLGTALHMAGIFLV